MGIPAGLERLSDAAPLFPLLEPPLSSSSSHWIPFPSSSSFPPVSPYSSYSSDSTSDLSTEAVSVRSRPVTPSQSFGSAPRCSPSRPSVDVLVKMARQGRLAPSRFEMIFSDLQPEDQRAVILALQSLSQSHENQDVRRRIVDCLERVAGLSQLSFPVTAFPPPSPHCAQPVLLGAIAFFFLAFFFLFVRFYG